MSEPERANRPSSLSRVALMGLGVVALLAVVAIASRAHRPGGGHGTEAGHPPTVIGDYIATLALVTMPLGALLIVWALAQRRREQQLAGRVTWRSTVVSVAVLAVLLLAGVFASEHFRGRGRAPRPPGALTQPGPQPQGTGKGKPAPQQAKPRDPSFQWFPILILGSVLFALAGTAAVAVARRQSRSGREERRKAELAAALAGALSDTLDDLRNERDPRRAVIAAYARMERILAFHGVPRRAFEAPLEYLARVLPSVQASAHSVRRLTLLFERAKFSQHSIDGGMKDDAIDALSALRTELQAAR